MQVASSRVPGAVLSCIRLVATPVDCSPTRLLCPWGFSRQESWGGLPLPPPDPLGIFPNRGMEPLVSCMGRKILYPAVTREALTTREQIHLLDLLISLTSHSLFSCGRGEFEPQIWSCPRALLKDVLEHSVHRMLPKNFTGMNYLLVIYGACKVIPFFFLKNISDDLIVL